MKFRLINPPKVKLQLIFAYITSGKYFCTWRDGMCDYYCFQDRRPHVLTRTLARFVSVSRTMEENLFSHSISSTTEKPKTVIAQFITTAGCHTSFSLGLIKHAADHRGKRAAKLAANYFTPTSLSARIVASCRGNLLFSKLHS